MAGELTLKEIQGQSATDVVRFDPASIKIALTACSNLLGHLKAVQDSLNRGSIDSATNMRDLAGPHDPFKSGRAWTEGFTALGQDMKTIIASHIAIVTELSETFRAAAIAYARTDEASKANFQQIVDGIQSIKMPEKASDPSPRPKVSDIDSDVPRAKIYSVKVPDDYTLPEGRTVRPETPTSLSWRNLYDFGQNIFSTTAVLAAADWAWMKSELEQPFSDFRSEIAKTDNSWISDAGRKARDTVTKYVEDTKPLIGNIDDVKKALLEAAGWLRAVNKEMPPTAEPVYRDLGGGWSLEYQRNGFSHNPSQDSNAHTKDECLEDALKKYRASFKDWYAAGIVEYNGSLVKLTAPTTQIGTPPAPPPPSNTDDKGPKDTPKKTDTPSTGSPGSVPTVTDPKDQQPNNQDPSKTDPKDQKPNNQDPSKTTTTTDSTAQTVSTLLQSLATQGTSLVESLAKEGSSLIQSLQKTTTTDTTTTAAQQVAALQSQLAALTNQQTVPTEPGSPGGSPTSPGGSPGGPNTTVTKENPQSRLFPRAGLATTEASESETTTRAGLATGASTTTGTGTGTTGSGMPMGSGGQAAGQGAGKEHKRAEFLRSGGNLDEVFEELPAAVRPVAEK